MHRLRIACTWLIKSTIANHGHPHITFFQLLNWINMKYIQSIGVLCTKYNADVKKLVKNNEEVEGLLL